MAETFFCPLIKTDCKKDECIMWRENDCVMPNFMFVHSKEKPVFADYTREVDEEEEEITISRGVSKSTKAIFAKSVEELAEELVDLAKKNGD